MLRPTEDVRFNDLRYNPMLSASIAGLAFGIYYFLLPMIGACAAKTKSKCLLVPLQSKTFRSSLIEIQQQNSNVLVPRYVAIGYVIRSRSKK